MVRLFFDEPLSEDLCKLLADIFPGSVHIRLLGEGGAKDVQVRDLARQRGCLLVSKDEDFHRLAIFAWGATEVCLDSTGQLLHGRHRATVAAPAG